MARVDCCAGSAVCWACCAAPSLPTPGALPRPRGARRSQARAQCEGPPRCLPWQTALPPFGGGMRRALCISRAVTGRKSPGAAAESAGPRGQDPRAPPRPRAGRAPGQLAIATVMWPVGSQPTNSTGLTLALTLTTPRRWRCGAAGGAQPAAPLRRRMLGERQWSICSACTLDKRASVAALTGLGMRQRRAKLRVTRVRLRGHRERRLTTAASRQCGMSVSS